jgi:hypothetical protein
MKARTSSFLPLLLTGAAILASACSDDTATRPPLSDGSTTSDGPRSDGAVQAGCPASTVELKPGVCAIKGGAGAPITTNLTLTADKQWVLQGGVFVGDDQKETVLTIEPGTTIFGDTAELSFLTIRRGSRIEAVGTKDKPIVFTSGNTKGSRKRGDWGGIIINGRASINSCDPATRPAGGCEAEGEGSTGKYGGNMDDDSSGTLKYVRVEFAGKQITSKNELNGLALQGVGSKTTLEYIQVHMGADDAIEFFGGTANFKYVLATGSSDDNLDWTDGWRGKGQFLVVQQYGDEGDNGIEADSNAENNTWTPRSAPVLSNITLIGSNTTFSDLGMLLREGTAATIANAIVTNWEEACVSIHNDETYKNAWDAAGNKLSGQLTLKNSIIHCTKPVSECKTDGTTPTCKTTPPFTVQAFVETLNTGNKLVDPKLTAATNEEAPNFVPAAGSPALSGAKVPSDPFFTQVSFIGGVDPANDWTKGWTTTDKN